MNGRHSGAYRAKWTNSRNQTDHISKENEATKSNEVDSCNMWLTNAISNIFHFVKIKKNST